LLIGDIMNLKIAFIYGNWCLGNRPINVNELFTSKRGLTGSELSCFMFAKEMAKKGHNTSLFIGGGSGEWEGVKIRDISEISSIDPTWDVAYSWNEPDLLRQVNANLRMMNQQLNDFAYCQPGYDESVDVYTSPSQTHMEFLKPQTPSPNKWAVIPNGCDPSQYSAGKKVPGRVIYASSPDRGLHLLMQAWPRIKKNAPHAHLKIFYNMDYWLSVFVGQEHSIYPDSMEYGYRARYIDLAFKRFADLGVERVGSVSREEIAQEMSEAEVLAYPCDTARFTEGFSVTTMEACAAGAVPVISSVDALGQIYGSFIPTVEAPVKNRLNEFADIISRSLNDEKFRNSVIFKAKSLAHKHKWEKLSSDLESLIMNKLELKRCSQPLI